MPGKCPSGGDHAWEHDSETKTTVTHKCSKCGATHTRAKGNRAVTALCLLAALVIVAVPFGLLWLAANPWTVTP
jgi:hypothetical protein